MATAALLAGPAARPLTGHLREYGRDPLGFLTRCAREYGDFVPLRFGPFPVLFINHPDDIERVLVGEYKNYFKGIFLQRNRIVFGNGLLVSEGDFWRRQRKLAQPAFHRERIAAYGDIMTGFTQRMVERWNDGETRDIHADMMALTMDIAVKTLFDLDASDKATLVGNAVTEGQIAITERMNSLLLFLPEALPAPANLRLRRAMQRLDSVIYGFIEERRREGGDRGDLLSLLLHAVDEEDGTGMNDKQLRDEVMTLFLAGHETTALALSWALYLLALHPEVAEKLAAEARDVLGERLPTAADRPRLVYTEWVVLETMRLYPPAWSLGRQAVQDCTLGGHPVPAKSGITFSQWVVHRDPRWFDEPEAFRPERWADDLAKRLPRFAYFPFGGGPRTCIGNIFAMIEAILALATIVSQYRFRLAPDQQIVPQPNVTLRPKSGLRLILERR